MPKQDKYKRDTWWMCLLDLCRHHATFLLKYTCTQMTSSKHHLLAWENVMQHKRFYFSHLFEYIIHKKLHLFFFCNIWNFTQKNESPPEPLKILWRSRRFSMDFWRVLEVLRILFSKSAWTSCGRQFSWVKVIPIGFQGFQFSVCKRKIHLTQTKLNWPKLARNALFYIFLWILQFSLYLNDEFCLYLIINE